MSMRDDSSTSKTFIFKTLDSLLPLIVSSLPDEIKSTHMCSLVSSSCSSLNEEKFNEFWKYLVFDSDNMTFFKIFINISNYLDSIVKSNINEEAKIQQIKQLNTILSLKAETIHEKEINFKIAGIDISKSINNLVNNGGYSYTICDNLLNALHIIIFKFLTIKISDFSITNLFSVIDDVFSIKKLS